jgi:PAS domain S-box-containing protein
MNGFSVMSLWTTLADGDDDAFEPLLLGTALVAIAFAGFALWVMLRRRREWLRTRVREQWLATMLGSIGDGVIATDAAGRITFMNRMAQELTAWKEADAHQKPLVKIYQTLDRKTREPAENPIDHVVRDGRTTSTVEPVLLVARDGAERLVLSNAAPLRDAGGAVSGVVFAFRDVTERELAESAYRASQEMFRIITDHISDYIAVLDLQGRRLFISNSFERILDTPREAQHTDYFSDLHPDDRQRLRALFEETIHTGTEQRAEVRLVGRHDKVIDLESVATLIRNRAGQPDKVLVVSRDITDRKRAEERGRAEREFSDTLINSMPGIFYLYDARRKILRWNKNLETVTGYTSEEFEALDPLTYFPDDEKALVHDRMLKCFAEGKADIEVHLQSKDGHRTPFYVTGFRIDVEGFPCMLGIGIDITARLTAEENLRETMHRLRRQNSVLAEQARSPDLLNASPDDALMMITELAAETLGVGRVSVWHYNDDRTKIRCSDLYEKAAHRHSSGLELTAADYPAYFRALAEERCIAADSAATDARTREFSPHYLEPHGIVSMLDAPIRGGGRMVGVVCHEHIGQPRSWKPDEQSFAGSMADLVSLSLEVTQRRQAEAALREAHANLEVKVAERTRDLADANERLKELDRLKSEFLSTMSHELRTPLNSIIGFTGIIRQGLAGPLTDEQKKQLDLVKGAARHLLRLINDLLDLSRIESGKAELNRETFRVTDLIDEVVEVLNPQVEQKKLRLESSLDDPGVMLHTDRQRCYQILLNLANNAIKFTDVGLIRISVHSTPAEVEIAVSDTGIGIKPENMGHIFEAFRQVDGSARRVYEGTGLGLYLCKQLANMLGGHMTAESEFGIGSRFSFTVPRALPAAESIA